METIYMDYNATTPVREEVLELMVKVCKECFGNPSSGHLLGRMSKACLEDARRKVAVALGANAMEIVFTDGGSESDNLAIKGTASGRSTGHVITTCIEHSAVRGCCKYLETRGIDVTCLPVDASGCVDPERIRDSIRDDTFLITVMWANNETGQIQPVEKIAEIARSHKILFHTDAVQAFGKVPVNVKRVPVDLLSISGHKFYAPKGVGVLYVRDGVKLTPEVHGGGQEMGLRSGTENIAGIAAMGEACRLALEDMDKEMHRIRALRDLMEKEILSAIPETLVNGDRDKRVPNTSNISFAGVESGRILQELDEHGIAVTAASACSSGSAEPSKVLLGMGVEKDLAMGAIRFSLGRYTEAHHIATLIEVLPGIISELRLTSSRK